MLDIDLKDTKDIKDIKDIILFYICFLNQSSMIENSHDHIYNHLDNNKYQQQIHVYLIVLI